MSACRNQNPESVLWLCCCVMHSLILRRMYIERLRLRLPDVVFCNLSMYCQRTTLSSRSPILRGFHAMRLPDAVVSSPSNECFAHRVMMIWKPSTQGPQEPAIPARKYPRGAIKVCLLLSVNRTTNSHERAYAEPPVGFPKIPERLPVLVRTSRPSIQAPARRWNPKTVSPLRVSGAMSQKFGFRE